MDTPQKKSAPEDSLEAINRRLFRRWLQDAGTQKFFRELTRSFTDRMKSAAKSSMRTGQENAGEHNKLVTANAYLHIIETYGRPEHYPFDELDDLERRRVEVNAQ